jgi:peptidoglycan hydrolase-like protein with peptidoglycan-binding domain
MRSYLVAKNITASVGLGGFNRLNDVKVIQTLLNQVPAVSGGPVPSLDVDGVCGPLTIGAVRAFQQRQFGWNDGRVDPAGQTLTRLNAFDSAPGGTPGITPAPPGAAPPPDLDSLRQRILGIAVAQAKAGPNGAVSDRDTAFEAGQTVRRGWRRLKEYFDMSVAGWTENHWKMPGYLAGVQLPGKRVPQTGTSGIQWCGIFATWVLIQAGLPVQWVLGRGISPLKPRFDRDFAPGDVCVMNHNVHHFIPIAIEGDTMQTVNGNSDFQSILIKSRGVKEVAYYYRTSP